MANEKKRKFAHEKKNGSAHEAFKKGRRSANALKGRQIPVLDAETKAFLYWTRMEVS